MKNFKLRSHKILKYNASSDWNFLCIDPVTKSKFIVNEEGAFEVSEANEDSILSLMWKDHDVNVTKVIGAEIVTCLNSLCVVTSDGDVITVNLEDHTVDVVGSVGDGIQSSIWSPDQELLTLVTGKLLVILMTVDFEPVSELSIEQEDFGENKFVNVGWGKKETQFHGSEGKQAAKELKKNSSTVFDWDTKSPKISWRGDGQLFAVSYVNSSCMRKIRIIDREGVIQSTSEDLEGIEEPLNWKPSGSLIASTQRLSNKHNVIFFEKNGLQHGNFTLPFSPMEVKVSELLWNSDSSILLVRMEPFEGKETIIQFWKVNNYHWYLKEELKFEDKIHDLKWDSETPLLLYIVSQTQIHDIRFMHCVNSSLGLDTSDTSQVAVIDGNKLLITPFRQAVIPPPMSAYEVVFPNQIHSVNYAPSKCEKSGESLNNSLAIEDSGFLETVDSPGSNSNNLCIFHGQNMVTFLVQANPNEQLSDFGIKVNITGAGGNGFTVQTSVHRVFSQIELELGDGLLETKHLFTSGHLYNWFWVTKNSFLCCFVKECKTSVVLFDFEGLGGENGKVSLRKCIDVEDEVVSISSSPDGSIACLQLCTGELLRLDVVRDLTVLPWTVNDMEAKFPEMCEEVILYPVQDNSYIPLGLTSRNRLYFENNQLLSDCTSLYMHNDHLLLTTSSHQLLVVPLYLEVLKSLSDKLNDEFSKVGLRRLERGSRIIRAIPEDTKVLLQMPRGNLEMINPRPLLIHKLHKLLDEKNYGTAVEIMKKHRIDMNMIYDYKPREFMSNLVDFVKAVEDPHKIDLFIASLNNDIPNLMVEPDKPVYPMLEEIEIDTCKVDLVCNNLKRAMAQVDREKYLLPIISALVKPRKSRIGAALNLLNNMKNENRTHKVSFEEGMRHLMYVADCDKLCDVALSMYDFDLIMMVYEKSQKDPKEYLPFLNNLWNLEDSYRKYKINVHLKDFSNALNCMQLCNESHNDEFLSLIKKESLYEEALQIFSYTSTLYFAVCLSYADYLYEKGFLNEAAAMYIRGLNTERAFEVYSETDNWKRVLITAFELKFSKEKLNKLYYSLVEKLKSKDCYTDAAFIYDKYIQSEEDAVECYCKVGKFEDAYLVSRRFGRSDLVDTHIKPGIVARARAYEEEISNKLLQFKTNLNRLIVVRVQKRKDYINFIEGNDSHIDSDLYSDSSTVTGFTHQRSNISKPMTSASLTSGKTYRSSKNKRKLERKKFSTKEGSINEDLGIVILLHDMMTSIIPLTNELSDFNRLLLLYPGFELYGRSFQAKLSKLIKEMQRMRYIIWPNCTPTDEVIIEFGPNTTAESISKHITEKGFKERDFIDRRMEELEPQYRYPPNLDNLTNWKLYSFRPKEL